MPDDYEAELTASMNAALRRAAVDVIERAKRHKTSVVVWKDGDVCEIPYGQLDQIPLDAGDAPIEGNYGSA